MLRCDAMNGSAVKASRRELRRAVGVPGMGALNAHAATIRDLLVRMADQARRGDHLAGRIARVEFPQDESDVTYRLQKILIELDGRSYTFAKATNTFWGRLRWFVRGI